MATTVDDVNARQDNNSLGKAAGIVGIIALIFSFIPIIGFVSWLLAPLAILFGLIALRRKPRSWALVGLVTGAIALAICFSWLSATESVGEAMSADTFNTTGEAQDLTDAPIMDASITGLWDELEANAVAAGQKYGGKRLAFAGETIADFAGDAANPSIQIVGSQEEYMEYYVTASFSDADGERIAALSKGDEISFLCTSIKESFGDGYNLSGCTLR